jgi:hypothetical protein
LSVCVLGSVIAALLLSTCSIPTSVHLDLRMGEAATDSVPPKVREPDL